MGMGFWGGIVHLIEVVLDKLRLGVLTMAVLVTWIIIDFGDKLILLLDDADVDPQLIITVLVGLISVGVGGLIAALVRMFESPQVPADAFERIMKQIIEEKDNK